MHCEWGQLYEVGSPCCVVCLPACLPARLVLERHQVGRVATIKLSGPLECGEEGSKRAEGKRYYYRGPLFVIARVYFLSLSLLQQLFLCGPKLVY
jgi:hypothetical protein